MNWLRTNTKTRSSRGRQDPPGRAPPSSPMPNFKDQSDSVSPGNTDLPNAIAVTAVPVVSTLTGRYSFSWSGYSIKLRKAIVCGCGGVVLFLIIFSVVVGILCGTGRCSTTQVQKSPVDEEAVIPADTKTTVAPIESPRPTISPSEMFETLFPTPSDLVFQTEQPAMLPDASSETDSPIANDSTPAPHTNVPTDPELTQGPTASPSTSEPTTRPATTPFIPALTERPTKSPITTGPIPRPTVAPVTLAPTRRPILAPVTQSPTTRPTKIPTERPTASPTEAFREKAKAIFSIVNDKASELVDYPADRTPEEKALKWLIEMDPAMSHHSVPPHQILQRYVLAIFWFQSGAVDLRNWMTGASECVWEGIRECDANGVIIHIYFENFGLQGSIPPDLGVLTDGLQNLDIDGNLFTGTIPSTLGFLTKLTWLDLGPNYLKGIIPIELGRLVNLEFADFRDNSLTGTFPSFVTSWTRLQRSFWYNNELEGSVPLDCSIEYIHLVVDCDTVVCPCCTHCCPESEGPIPSYDDECEGDRCTCTPANFAP